MKIIEFKDTMDFDRKIDLYYAKGYNIDNLVRQLKHLRDGDEITLHEDRDAVMLECMFTMELASDIIQPSFFGLFKKKDSSNWISNTYSVKYRMGIPINLLNLLIKRDVMKANLYNGNILNLDYFSKFLPEVNRAKFYKTLIRDESNKFINMLSSKNNTETLIPDKNLTMEEIIETKDIVPMEMVSVGDICKTYPETIERIVKRGYKQQVMTRRIRIKTTLKTRSV